MKFLLLTILITLSVDTFSQSYLIMDNGIVITTDTNGFSYDFGHYAFPQKVTLKGGQYFVEEGNILATIDENGLLFRKYEIIPEKIRGKGINYFISFDGVFYAIDKKGYLKVTESDLYRHALNFGGNYFTVLNPETNDVELFVVNSEGVVVRPEIPSLKVRDIVSFGGTYFMNNRGIIYTVSSDGQVTQRDEHRVGILQKRGGNFFLDSSGFFYSVTESGELKMPPLPLSMKAGGILKLGSNYFIDQNGKFFIIDKNGFIYEREMRDHDFRLTKIISL